MLHFYCPLEIKKSGQTHLKLQIEFDWRDRTRPLVIKTSCVLAARRLNLCMTTESLSKSGCGAELDRCE